MRPGLLSLLLLTACPPAEPPPGVTSADAGSAQPPTPPAPCLHAFPDALEFGEIDAFTTAIGKVRITNSSPGTVLLHATPVAEPWVVTPADAVLRAGTSLLFDVRFEPTDSLLHFAELELTASQSCTIKVPMRGLGAGSVTVSPPQLDFGVMEPGERKTLELQFTNTRRLPVSLNQLGLVDVFASDGGQPPFTLELDLDAGASLELPPLSITPVRVTATPTDFDLFSATLTAGTAFGRINVALQVVGGRPRAELTPEAIDVPTVGFWAGSNPPSFVDRVVTLRNVGDAGSSSSALRLISPFTLVEALDGRCQ